MKLSKDHKKDTIKLSEDHKKDTMKLSEDHKKDTMKLSEDIIKLSEDHKKDTMKLSEEKFALSEEKYKLMAENEPFKLYEPIDKTLQRLSEQENFKECLRKTCKLNYVHLEAVKKCLAGLYYTSLKALHSRTNEIEICAKDWETNEVIALGMESFCKNVLSSRFITHQVMFLQSQKFALRNSNPQSSLFGSYTNSTSHSFPTTPIPTSLLYPPT
ncbi:hypothetical protein F8M41_018610 [Gigaspora margarita]|uniref:Uncharacterized protein n=1 Tax=Gigaspora margarita TaxID=4874 RepID=A0A8H4AL53_GIGMA|nr:hypothetical protein F8M41_018610 [Gigaspora margarita]